MQNYYKQGIPSLCCAEKRRRGEGSVPPASEPKNLTGVTLADLLPQSADVAFKEEDMQPVVTDLIQAVMTAVKCDSVLHDTHLSSNQLENPVSPPDCVLVAEGDRAEWTQLVSVWEVKTGTGKPEIETMYGQQVERCWAVLDSYDQRQFVVAVNVTMNTIEVMTAQRQAGGDLRLSTTSRQPFSISEDSSGFQLLVRLLSTPKANLGFATPLMPAIQSMRSRKMTVQYLVRQGSADQGLGSWVFCVKLNADENAVLKLNTFSHEVNQLSITIMLVHH